MDSKRWEEIKAICLAALDRPVEERSAYVHQACGVDSDLLREVQSLLAEHDADPEFMDVPLVRLPDLPDSNGLAESLEARHVGPYRLVRPLGRGGMGDVYLAVKEVDDFRQAVALKLIRRGLDTDEVLRRFRLERQILASLHHPNIAQLHDGGATEDGRPYFVMEYVEGTPIDEYSDANRLSVRRRLELFQTVCGAVQHAHQNLVVHRDIKHTNILVTDDGIPKLLDFGIGKVLAPLGSFGTAVATRTDVRMLTPEYAAPEQVRGEPVTTATDVYALGLLLYELLVGHHPYASGTESPQEIERAVCETDPDRPSTSVTRVHSRALRDGTTQTLSPEEVGARRSSGPDQLRRRLAGDLDNIVLMALRKEPARRYSSASALADDVQRHLDGMPVLARPDTVRYRTEKFVRRHAWAVTAAAAAFVGLTATTTVTLVQSRRVAEQRDIALDERDKAVEVRGFLMEMFGATGADQATDTLTARQLLDLQAARMEETYSDQPELRAEMMDVLADGYDRLGLAGEAQPWAVAALELRRETLGGDDPDLAASLNTLGWVLHEQGRSDEAEPLLRDAVRIRRSAGDAFRPVLSRSLNDLGIVVETLGQLEEAEAMYREALDIRLDEFGPNHRSVGITANNLAVGLFRQGSYAEAAEFEAHALQALRSSVEADHQRSIVAQSNLALMQRRSGDLESAEDVFRDLVSRQTRLQGPVHPVTAWVMEDLASVLGDAGKLDEAEHWYREAAAVQEAVLDPDHPDLASTILGLGRVLTDQGAFGEAEASFERALSIQVQRFGETHRDVGAVVAAQARLYEQTSRPDEALASFQRALSVWVETLGPDHQRTVTLRGELEALQSRLGRPPG